MQSISRPTVSVVTPSFNQGTFIEETIRSVLGQSYTGVEYIIIDGGSTDGTVDTIRRYEDKLAYWISEPDQGQADALRRGFARASGEILAYLNTDDQYMPGAVETAVKTFQANPDLALVHGDTLIVNAVGETIGHKRGREGDYLSYFLRMDNPISQPSAFWRRTDYEAVGGVDPTLHLIMDYDLWNRLGLPGRKFQYINKNLSRFRIHAASKTGQGMIPFEQERYLLLQKYLQDPQLAPILRPYEKRLLAAVHLRLANAYWVAGEKQPAHAHYQKALRFAPRIAASWPSINLLARFAVGRRSFRRQMTD